MNSYERTKDAAILSNIVKLSLSIYDNAINAFLAVRGIRVRNPEHLSQVVHNFIPNDVVSSDLRDFLIKCFSQTDCNADFIGARVRELGRLVDYVHSVSTHSVIHRGGL